jgi:hypothetical protein
LCQDSKKAQDFTVSALFEDEGSDASSGSETRLEEEEEDNVEEDNFIVEIGSEVEIDEDEEVVVPETEDVVVPSTQDYVQVVVFEKQPEADVDNQPPDFADGHNYGGFNQPAESEGDDYLSYSQFSSQLSEQVYTGYHCGNGISTDRCPTCTYRVGFIWLAATRSG